MQIDTKYILYGYKKALNIANQHYENFPVVSWLIPKGLREHIAIIYWFARTADDYADEGNLSLEQRLEKLNIFENSLKKLLNGKFDSPFEAALYNTITERNLTHQLFRDLLSAFKQDVVKKRYQNFNEVLDYCRRSANPIGRLILELFNIRNDMAFYYSDKICTALQLTNFYQDLRVDYERGRIYLSEDEMTQFNVAERDFNFSVCSSNLAALLEHNVNRTQDMFNDGKKLLTYLSGRLKLEIRCTIFGGEAILNKIRKSNYKVLSEPPRLTKKDFGVLFMKSLFVY